MQTADLTMLIIWWVVPMVILLARAALAAYRTRQKRTELRELEERATPFTRRL
ncbi:MAG: hypothetical protein ACTSVD_09505 [Candidatus Thorarchaeota archaeon]